MTGVAMLHYAGPPVVGGVEVTIAYHARGLAARGIPVQVISGSGGNFDERATSIVEPLFGSTHPEVLRVKQELDSGQVTDAFHALTARVQEALEVALAGCDVCIAHNVPSLHKNLPLTAALAALSAAGRVRVVAWCHDLAWTNDQYLRELHDGQPWDLLRRPWPGVRYVTVSEARRGELAALMGIRPDAVSVVTPGVDPERFLHWTPTMADLERRLKLLDADGLLLVPARLTRRKNIEMALRILSEVRRQSQRDFRLIVTGPPGPHNPANPGYLGELLDLRRELEIEDSAHFLYAYGQTDEPFIPDDDTMANLYQVADALLFPSAQEGFGIPVLEAGLAALPVICADIPPLRHTGRDDVVYFDPLGASPRAVAATILDTLESAPGARLRVRVRQLYRWEAIIRDRLLPLIAAR
jgi:glycosyltransferase involved in cell wall biosynthesis